MKIVINFIILTFLCVGFIFSKERVNNSREFVKKVKVDYSILKDQFKYEEGDQLDRKRSHKRRRKIRKPKKGLR